MATRPEFSSFDRQPDQRRGVLVYLRVSKEEQRHGASLDEQERRIREKFEQRLGLEILEVYADEGASAFKDHERRENFWRMIDRAKSDPRVAIIAVDEESRFYRDRYRAASIKGELLEHGVTVQTVRADYDPLSASGLFMEAIEEVLAHTGSLKNREWTMRGMAGNVRRRDPKTGWCYKNGGTPPYGYRAVRVETGEKDARGRLVMKQLWEIDEAQAAIVRRIYAARIAGASYKAIRDALNAEAIPSARGGKWSTTSIQTLLREDYVWTYAGVGIWNKHYRKHKPRPGLKFKPSSEWIIEPKAHPAIITEEEARQVLEINRKLTERWAKMRGHEHTSTYILSGDGLGGEPLFVCFRCGGRVIGSRAGRGRRKYVCTRAVNYGDCIRRYVDAELVEREILDHIKTHYLTEAYIRAVVKAVNEQLAREERTRATDPRRERLRDVERQLEQAKKALLAGADPDILAGELNRLNAEAKTLRDLLEQQEETKAARPRRIDEGQAAEILQGLLSDLEEGDRARLREFVATFVRQLTLNPDRYTVAVTFQPDPRSGLHPVSMLVGLDQAKRYRVDVVPPTGLVIHAKPPVRSAALG